MRVTIPEELKKEGVFLWKNYMEERAGEGWTLKRGVPKEIEERYRKWNDEMDKLSGY